MKNKKVQLIIVVIVLLFAMITIIFCCNRGRKYNISITIPASGTEAFIYSDEEISPQDNTITLILLEKIWLFI